MEIRRATENDIPQIKDLFQQTILAVNTKDYTLEQARWWASKGNDDDLWKERIGQQYFVVAMTNKVVTGFAALKADGYLNSLFVHKDYQGKGIASLLLFHIENYAVERTIYEITVDVSITAKPFFERKGYLLLQQQIVNIGIEMINYKMNKFLYIK